MSPKLKRKIRRLKIHFFLILLLIIPFTNACSMFRNQLKPHFTRIPKIVTMQVTAYCSCEKCCGWKLNPNGESVYAYGPHKGKRKVVGMTASGTKAVPGTIAADISIYPLGTIMYIEGYGYGRVEDVGSKITQQHIDLFFKDHATAMNWGNRRMKVKVWLPK
ncbi:MAG: 3D domain-containing protein [Candidatus Neomarinimicrobiota bacterium]|jgi:3D (Asp-Asp-Asp) domain-containing protein|nr:3D domain-containing protein [Candidatus Neomarinimicrobiota bacterium]MDD3965602.1 3D domain-containing protein [Candidatus Neomarinimicrobiota bacterium]MDX9779416.1 3D domain-containing protein [bacterium]